MSERLLFVPVPALVAVLMNRERKKGTPLTEAEVLALRDSAECIAMPPAAAAEVAEQRGYEDIRPEHAWEDWKAVRPSLGL